MDDDGWTNEHLDKLLQSVTRCRELEAKVARLHEAIRKARDLSYRPGTVYRILDEALTDEART